MILPTHPSVSVVMPCFNGRTYLTQAIESALAQTVRPTQILIVDDGSTDDSAEVIRQYQRYHRDANIELLTQLNAGEPAARNAGIAHADGEWVAMLDTDDWWEPEKLELQLKAAAEQGPDCVLVHTGVKHHFHDGSSQGADLIAPAKRVGWATRALLEDGAIGHPSILVRRDALATIGGYDATFTQACDIDLYFRLSVIGTFAFAPQYLLNYRIHPGQMSTRAADQVRAHHRAVRRFFEEHPELEKSIGRPVIDLSLTRHIESKLQSLYWRRKLDQFRDVLDYADRSHLDTPAIREWQRRGRVPAWLLRVKDMFDLTGRTA